MRMKIILALTASVAAGCAVIPPQQAPTPGTAASSQPATSSTTPTPSPLEASLTKGMTPTTNEPNSLYGYLFPERLKDITVPIGRTPVGMWMYNSPDDGEVQEFTYNIAWMSKVQKLESFDITVNHLPAFTASSSTIVYNALTPAVVSGNIPLGNSKYPTRFDAIVAWATIPKEAQALGLQVTLDVARVKKVSTGEVKDPGVPAMAADAVIVKWWQ